MKDISRNIGVITVALIAISVGATLALVQNPNLQLFSAPAPISGAYMTGHVEVVLRDEAGNVIAYRQADNAIVQHGMAILIDQLFLPCIGGCGGPGSGGNHTNDTDGRIGYMQVGNGTAAPAGNDRNIQCPLNFTGAGCVLGGNEQVNCGRVRAEVGNQSASLNGGAAQINITAVATFDGNDCTSNDIREAGIFNNVSANAPADPPGPGGEMFARNTFGGVDLTINDSLELTWKFTFTDQLP